jgi:hypothetical protein
MNVIPEGQTFNRLEAKALGLLRKRSGVATVQTKRTMQGLILHFTDSDGGEAVMMIASGFPDGRIVRQAHRELLIYAAENGIDGPRYGLITKQYGTGKSAQIEYLFGGKRWHYKIGEVVL